MVEGGKGASPERKEFEGRGKEERGDDVAEEEEERND